MKIENYMKLSGYVLITEAAEFLGVTTNTLKNWQQAGKIKTYLNPINNWRLYKKKDLEDILNSIKPVEHVNVCDNRRWCEKKEEEYTLEDRLDKVEYLNEGNSGAASGNHYHILEVEEKLSALERRVSELEMTKGFPKIK